MQKSNTHHSCHLSPCCIERCFSNLCFHLYLKGSFYRHYSSFAVIFLHEIKTTFEPFLPLCSDSLLLQTSSNMDSLVWYYWFVMYNCQKNLPALIKGIDKVNGILIQQIRQFGACPIPKYYYSDEVCLWV